MAGRVIQGYFIGGVMRSRPGLRAATAEARPRHPTGAPPPAFAGPTAPLQARMAPGRPPLAHQGAGHVAQPHGGNGSFAIDPVQLGLARGGGKPLPQTVLAKMEAAFGADFSGVRVHVGPQAARIGAVAFTMGNDLYFTPGRYEPSSVQGQQLIGHELAHVIQQRQGRVRASSAGLAVVQDRALEAEADRLGMRAALHRAPVQSKLAWAPEQRGAPSASIQRASDAKQVPGMAGFLLGALSASQEKGGRSTVYSQPSIDADRSAVAHSSSKLGVNAAKHLVDFAQIEHLEDSKNTHAEDKLCVHIQQESILSHVGSVFPEYSNYELEEFFVSASPCTSCTAHGKATSTKLEGCTENLIKWHTDGIPVISGDSGNTKKVKLTIGKLTVEHLYKGNTNDGATASYEALVRLKNSGAVKRVHISRMPMLKIFKGKPQDI